MMGEIAMLCPTKVNKRMYLMLQSIIFHQYHDKNDKKSSEIPSSQTQSSQPPATSFKPTTRLQVKIITFLFYFCELLKLFFICKFE